jgi:hypothetical protein
MVRGSNKSDIFEDDQDKARFLERLGQNVIDGQCSVYAWVLMGSGLIRGYGMREPVWQQPNQYPTGGIL